MTAGSPVRCKQLENFSGCGILSVHVVLRLVFHHRSIYQWSSHPLRMHDITSRFDTCIILTLLYVHPLCCNSFMDAPNDDKSCSLS